MKLPAASCGASKRSCAVANPPSLFELLRGSPRHISLLPRKRDLLLRRASLLRSNKLQGILAKANKKPNTLSSF